jgi:hypothetical protein
MREGISIEVGAADREQMAVVVADRNSPQKHVWRARITLATAEGCGTAEIMRRTGVSKPSVWRWQERFMREGVAGLVRDKTRKPGLPPLPPAQIARAVELTLGEQPGEATHWTGRAMAAATGISLRSVQRIWAAHGLQPHRVRRFKLSQDPAFATKLRDVVGLYLDPPAHSLVLSVDEKSQIQALDRTELGLPMKKGRAGTMTHDYIRHGTTTLFAALNVLDATVIGQCMARHHHLTPRSLSVSLPHRGRGACRQADPCDPRQLCRPQASQSARLARLASALDVSFHAHFLLLGQCGRELLRLAHPPAAATRRLSLAGRPASRNQPLPRRAQPQTKTLRLDGRP